MAKLKALSPCHGLLPQEIGGVTLVEAELGHVTVLMPFKGQEAALSQSLQAGHGMAFPSPGRTTGPQTARAVWSGKGQAMLIGPKPDDAALSQSAGLVDQSDAWAAVTLTGPGCEAVLARLVPIDLRASVFPTGHVARSLVGAMNALVLREGADQFTLMVFRSMAATLVHELERAAKGVAERPQ